MSHVITVEYDDDELFQKIQAYQDILKEAGEPPFDLGLTIRELLDAELDALIIGRKGKNQG